MQIKEESGCWEGLLEDGPPEFLLFLWNKDLSPNPPPPQKKSLNFNPSYLHNMFYIHYVLLKIKKTSGNSFIALLILVIQ